MEIIKIIILSYIITCINSYSQNSYNGLYSTGKIPGDFLELSLERYIQDKKSIDKEQEGYIKKAEKNFYFESSFQIRDLLFSGKVLFNDPISNYCQTTFRNLLKNSGKKY